MKTLNTLLITIASLSTFVAADAKAEAFAEANVNKNADSFTISARDLDLYARDAYDAGHSDAMNLVAREAFPPKNHPTFPAGSFANLPPSKPHDVPHRQWNDPTPPQKPSEHGHSYFPPPGGSSSRIQPAGRRPGSAKRSETEGVVAREAFPPKNHPTFPAGSFANLPPSKPHDVPHRQWNDPTPPQKPSEHGHSYFPPPGGSSSRIQPAKHRAGSAKRSEIEVM